jgi:hypothetical protein
MKSFRPSLISVMIDFPTHIEMFGSASTAAIGFAEVLGSAPAKSGPATKPASSTMTDPESPWTEKGGFCAVSDAMLIWSVRVRTPMPSP